MIKTMMKVSGLSRAQLEAMGEEKFFAKYGQKLKQELGGNLDNNTTPDPKKKSGDQLNREAYQRSLLQAQQETARERVQKNMQEVTNSSLWNLPGNVYMGIPKYGINLGKGAFNALKHNAKMLGLAQADNLINEGVNQVKENYAMGGNMRQYAKGGQLTRFDEGGTHEENPLGGIPQGEDSQGVMNTVEQGETKKGNYVYSDRLSIDENMAKQLNLPGYIKGKSFANASKAIDNKFRDRSDQYSQETKRTLLDRLKQAQEALKQQEQQKAQQLAQAMQANAQQSPGMGNNQIPPGMEQYVQSPQEEMVEGQASNPQEEMMEQPMEQQMANGGMIKRVDGSYSRRGLWDNIRANAGSGNEPTKEMLDQEKKIRANAYGGMMNRYDLGGMPEVTPIGGSLKAAGQTLSGPTSMPTAAMPTASRLNPTKGNLSGTTSTGLSGADALGYLGMAKSVADGDIKGAAMSGAQMAAAKGLFGAGAQNAMAAAGPALGVVGAGMGAYQLSEMAKGKGISRNKTAGALQGAFTGAAAGTGVAPGVGTIIGAGAGLAAGAFGHDAAMRNYGQEMGRQALAKNSVYNDPSQIKSQRSAYGGYLNQLGEGGGIHINPANKGKFTASAQAAGMGTQEFARHVLANKEDYSSTQVKRANFAHNAAGWHHAMGGQMNQFEAGGPIKPGFFSSLFGKVSPSIAGVPKANANLGIAKYSKPFSSAMPSGEVNLNSSFKQPSSMYSRNIDGSLINTRDASGLNPAITNNKVSSNLGMPSNTANYNNAFANPSLPIMGQPMAPSSMYSNRIEPGLRRTSPSLNLDRTIDTSGFPSLKGMPTTDFAASKFRSNNKYVPGAPNQIGKRYKPGLFSSSDRFIDKTPIFGDKYNTGLPGKPGMFSKEGTLGRAGEFIKENYGEMLNAAPALYNAYKAMNPETSDAVAYSRLGDTYKKSYIDRAALENINREETNNTINALTNAAGGSNAGLMSGYAAANLGRIKGRSDAYLKADAYDAEQNAFKQEFDSGMNIRNQTIDTAEKIAQAQNDAAARNMNREYAAAAMEGIGKFGKQQFDKKQIARTLGYDYKGGYIVDKAGNRVSPEDLAKAQANAKKLYEDTTATQAAAYGGYLRTIKRMR